MNEIVAAAVATFVFGFLSGIGLAAALRRRGQVARWVELDPVTVRLRAVRRSRVAVVEQRLAALEHAVTRVSPPVARPGRVQTSPRDVVDPDALEALQALGYRRGDARTKLSAIPADVTTTEERIAAVLRASGSG